MIILQGINEKVYSTMCSLDDNDDDECYDSCYDSCTDNCDYCPDCFDHDYSH